MKFLILTLAFAAAASAQHHGNPSAQPAILRQSQDISPDGSYNYAFETENGIKVAESGSPGPLNEDGQPAVAAQGSFQYPSPEGGTIEVSYIADENGFQPQGAHLPVPPPIPAQIQRALEYIRAHGSQEDRNVPTRAFNPQTRF